MFSSNRTDNAVMKTNRLMPRREIMLVCFVGIYMTQVHSVVKCIAFGVKTGHIQGVPGGMC